MSLKTQFLQKLQARQAAPAAPTSRGQADIATFRLRMEQLQAQMDAWLAETGLNTETFAASVPDLLVAGGSFDISGLVLRYDDRAVAFTPVFLYGQGVTGCVDVRLQSIDRIVLLGRLFMRNGNVNVWTFTAPREVSRPGSLFDEATFFGLISGLLP